jgi:lipoprotein-anchoring transpeptidase ErfK/SrfK
MKPAARILPFVAAGALALAAIPTVASASGSASKSPYQPAAKQEVATLWKNHTIYKTPGGPTEGSVNRHRPITGEETRLPVLSTQVKGSVTYLLVRLPGRPNSHTGWIRESHTTEWYTVWHIVVSTGQRRAYIYKNGKVVRDWLVVVGKPSTPTPHGQFFVEENVDEQHQNPPFPGGPYALATSARSNVYTSFDGGPGQIALHGMANGLQATPGTAVSHGCVRFTNSHITWLATRAGDGGDGIYPGTPVTITG